MYLACCKCNVWNEKWKFNTHLVIDCHLDGVHTGHFSSLNCHQHWILDLRARCQAGMKGAQGCPRYQWRKTSKPKAFLTTWPIIWHRTGGDGILYHMPHGLQAHTSVGRQINLKEIKFLLYLLYPVKAFNNSQSSFDIILHTTLTMNPKVQMIQTFYKVETKAITQEWTNRFR